MTSLKQHVHICETNLDIGVRPPSDCINNTLLFCTKKTNHKKMQCTKQNENRISTPLGVGHLYLVG